jgi:hypothetical protein
MRAKTTIWTRRIFVAAAAGATVVLLGAGAGHAAPAHHAQFATVADATWGSPSFSVFGGIQEFAVDDATWG